jgi:hypothetical protein
MTVLDIIYRERQQARETGYKRIVHIRVTKDAILGAPTTVPVTPERARTLGRLLMVRSGGLDGVVVADPSDYERMLELLIHPEDWAALLTEKTAFGYAVELGTIDHVMGIPVSH